MPPKVPIITKQYLQDVPLPTHAGTYTVISHASIMQYVEDNLAQKGLIIEDSIFRAAQFGQVATGTYLIKDNRDEEIGLMISFVNSYNKLLRFGCTVGGYNKHYGNFYIARNVATWKRKHTGTADSEAKQHIDDQINLVSQYLDNIIKSRDIMSRVSIIPQLRASILGYIYFEKNLLTPDQASQIRKNLTSPLVNYPSDNLWELYNHITMVLKSAHPKDWINHQGEVHDILINTYASNLSAKIDNDNEDLPGQLAMFNEPDHLGAIVSGMSEVNEGNINKDETESGFINTSQSFVVPEPDEPDFFDLD